MRMGCCTCMTFDQYLAENIEAKGLVLLSRMRFWCDQKDTSAFSKRPDCPHTLFFEAFKAQPIILDKEENVAIHPVFLAKAFLHKDIYNIAKELSSAIFTQEDLKRRNDMLQRGITEPNKLLDAFSPRKIDLIERMTKWIYEKQHCPWVISPDLLKQVVKWMQENKFELGEIDRALLSFDKISDFREYGLPASEFNQNIPAFQQWVNNETDSLARVAERYLRDPNFIPPNSDTIYPGTPQDVDFQRISENWNYAKIFQDVIAQMEKGSLVRCTTADLVRALTLATTPHCDDVFLGATQFTIQRWLKVQRYFTRGEVPAKMAEILFRKFLFDFEKKTFTDIDKDFCPIKFLDITRAVAKLMQNGDGDSHNKFLNWETIDEIKRFLNEEYKGKRYNPSTSKFEPYYSDGEVSNPSTMGNLNSQVNYGEERMETYDTSLLTVTVQTDNVELGTSETIRSSQPANIEVGPSVPQTAKINYKFDERHNLILLDFGVTVEYKVWNDVIKFKEKNTKNRVISKNEERLKKLFDKLLTKDEKRSQHSGRNRKKKYPQHKVKAMLATLSILDVMDGMEPANFQGLVNCKGPTAYELTLTQEEKKVFIDLGNRRRNAKPKTSEETCKFKFGSSKREKRS